MNKSIFMGRLIRDPEIRYSQTDNGEMAVAIFRIAVDRKFVRRDGVKADFITCSAFGRLAEFVEQYLLQGLKVIVTGRMENDNYTNRNGEKVYGMRLMAEDIEFAESKKAMEERMQAEQDAQNGRNSAGRSKRPGSASRIRAAQTAGQQEAETAGNRHTKKTMKENMKKGQHRPGEQTPGPGQTAEPEMAEGTLEAERLHPGTVRGKAGTLMKSTWI